MKHEVLIPGNSVCGDCGHSKIDHEGYFGCTGCAALLLVAKKLEIDAPFERCRRRFVFQIPRSVREQAVKAAKDSFDFYDVCVCGAIWGQHRGFLCPSGDNLFEKIA